jgi:hypothetical protein
MRKVLGFFQFQNQVQKGVKKELVVKLLASRIVWSNVYANGFTLKFQYQEHSAVMSMHHNNLDITWQHDNLDITPLFSIHMDQAGRYSHLRRRHLQAVQRDS